MLNTEASRERQRERAEADVVHVMANRRARGEAEDRISAAGNAAELAMFVVDHMKPGSLFLDRYWIEEGRHLGGSSAVCFARARSNGKPVGPGWARVSVGFVFSCIGLKVLRGYYVVWPRV